MSYPTRYDKDGWPSMGADTKTHEEWIREGNPKFSQKIDFRETSQYRILMEVAAERTAQDQKFIDHVPFNFPNGTGTSPLYAESANIAKKQCKVAFEEDRGTWRHLMIEETCEAFAESDPDKLRTELIQVAAVAVAWIECLDRKTIENKKDNN